jgi:hypothetical protein
MEKEIKIQVPEGYEIDKDKSTFEKIVFKKKDINCWEDLEKISGCGITTDCSIEHWSGLSAIDGNENVFLNEKYAKSALALAQISQLLPYYDSNVDWNRSAVKSCIIRKGNEIVIDTWQSSYHLLAFNTREEAKRFLKYNEQLVKDYFML